MLSPVVVKYFATPLDVPRPMLILLISIAQAIEVSNARLLGSLDCQKPPSMPAVAKALALLLPPHLLTRRYVQYSTASSISRYPESFLEWCDRQGSSSVRPSISSQDANSSSYPHPRIEDVTEQHDAWAKEKNGLRCSAFTAAGFTTDASSTAAQGNNSSSYSHPRREDITEEDDLE